MRSLLTFALLLSLAACGSDADAPPEAPDAPTATAPPAPDTPPSPEDALADAMDQLQDALGEDGARASAPVDFRDLRALVPEDAAGFTRSEIEGATEGAMGLSISRVEADFTDADGATADVDIVDLGTFPQIGMFGVGWTALTIDRESSSGYERTTTFEGYPAYEEVDGDYAELQVVVANRFLVSAEGRVPMATLKDLVRAHDLDGLAAMRGVNVDA
ncbi:MAG: hypothetical protein AAF809_05055 [Bacteroidota bacterium]